MRKYRQEKRSSRERKYLIDALNDVEIDDFTAVTLSIILAER